MRDGEINRDRERKSNTEEGRKEGRKEGRERMR
jgi:hypothetical protein